jgi:prolyl 4-hydroxylase
MSTPSLSPALRAWIWRQAKSGQSPATVVEHLLENGWDEQSAINAVEDVVREFLAGHARHNDLPLPVRVPAPTALNDAAAIDVGDRSVHVLASLLHPRIVVFGGLLATEECRALIALGSDRLMRSNVVNPESGHDELHAGRTSEGASLPRGANALCRGIEERIARLLEWPIENGEGLQILRYAVGAQYRPHHDYFDPAHPGMKSILARGGQRVASLVIYLSTPSRGGATTFPEAGFEVAAIEGNAVFFTYDRPHPMTRTLHGGAPVLEGEKWVATKWLRERRHD